MKIKRFFAEDIRQAMRMVKEELGADAVIMSNKSVDGGVEIVAARDFDEQSIQSKLQKEVGQPAAAPQTRRMELPDFEAEKNHLHVLGSQRKQSAEGFAPERPSVQPYQFPTEREAPANPGARRNIDQYVGYAEKVHLRGNLETVTAKPANNPARPATNGAARPVTNTRPVAPTPIQRPQPAQMARPAVKQGSPADNLLLEMGNEIKSLRSALDAKLSNDNWANANGSARPNTNARPVAPAPAQRPQPVERPMQIAMPGIKPSSPADDLLLEMGKELKSLRAALNSKLSNVSWAHTTQAAPTNPVRIDLLKRLAGMSISKKLSVKIANRFVNHTNADAVFNQVQELLAKVLPVANDDLLQYGGIAALVGPTGVGKTTTITKLAARFILQHGPGQVALITTDNYRIGAHEQLGIYGRILDVPVRVASSAAELHHLINGFADKRLILIDTAG
ncbi:MAG: flagellar biosynthesis protein FlhF, partial [Methylobacter sp.]|nr:flagellar biosynthesis protein FlhF [Methylobacter sp.]